MPTGFPTCHSECASGPWAVTDFPADSRRPELEILSGVALNLREVFRNLRLAPLHAVAEIGGGVCPAVTRANCPQAAAMSAPSE